MASNAEKLAKIEARMEQREKKIAALTDALAADKEEYTKIYVLTLADKYKLKGKDLFSAIEREHEQLEKLREGEQSNDDTDSTSTVGDTAVRHGSFPRNNMSEGALNE